MYTLAFYSIDHFESHILREGSNVYVTPKEINMQDKCQRTKYLFLTLVSKHFYFILAYFFKMLFFISVLSNNLPTYTPITI